MLEAVKGQLLGEEAMATVILRKLLDERRLLLVAGLVRATTIAVVLALR